MSLLERLPLPSQLGLVAAVGSGALLGGAYYFQYEVGLAPCDMCLWQRWPHMAAIGVGLCAVGSYAWPRLALVFTLTAILALFITAGIGVFHAGVEQQWWTGPQTCSGRIPTGLSADELRRHLFNTRMVRCDEISWKMWGISMAGWNAIISGAIALLLSSKVANHIRERP